MCCLMVSTAVFCVISTLWNFDSKVLYSHCFPIGGWGGVEALTVFLGGFQGLWNGCQALRLMHLLQNSGLLISDCPLNFL